MLKYFMTPDALITAFGWSSGSPPHLSFTLLLTSPFHRALSFSKRFCRPENNTTLRLKPYAMLQSLLRDNAHFITIAAQLYYKLLHYVYNKFNRKV